jgi:hypothetical protein
LNGTDPTGNSQEQPGTSVDCPSKADGCGGPIAEHVRPTAAEPQQPEKLPPIVVTGQKSSSILAAATLAGVTTSEFGIREVILVGAAIYAVIHSSNTGSNGQASNASSTGLNHIRYAAIETSMTRQATARW